MLINLQENQLNILDEYNKWYKVSQEVKKIRYRNKYIHILRIILKISFYIFAPLAIHNIFEGYLYGPDYYSKLLILAIPLITAFIVLIYSDLTGNKIKRDGMILYYKSETAKSNPFTIIDRVEIESTLLRFFSSDKHLEIQKKDILIVDTKNTIYICYKGYFLFKSGVEFCIPLIINKSIFKSNDEIENFYESIKDIDTVTLS
ncbi:hypothetical protein H8S20_07730 [Clostridium sp. NSJ-6]|uniref:YcxB-like protein domain-containing protein n=1 Tax=Clostridium hominis TaxID=2763036 RepID=A0ABR7DBR3_9CLOT|nr:hypothetical protein [Clostridium hominis]MBC5628777.1 hypothetical protein [Clostridium hominis]MDU2671669.1 hypothetical protein [Clostridium sp.]